MSIKIKQCSRCNAGYTNLNGQRSKTMYCGKCGICHGCSKIMWSRYRSRCDCRGCPVCKGTHKYISCGCTCPIDCNCAKKSKGIGRHSFRNIPEVNIKDNKELKLKRAIGLEIELVGLNNEYIGNTPSNITRMGVWTSDGSVQPLGAEWVFNPLRGDMLINCVGKFIKFVTSPSGGRATVNDTCGLHIHVDARDFDFYDLGRLIVLWGKIENDMYRLCREDRATNGFCWPYTADIFSDNENGKKLRRIRWWPLELLNKLDTSWIPAKEVKELVIQAIYRHKITWPKSGNDVAIQGLEYLKNLYNDKYLRSYRAQNSEDKLFNPRYAGLNLHSYFYRNTIEFRMKEGTLVFDEVLSWAILCGSIIELAKNISYGQLQSVAGLMDLLRVETKQYTVPESIINYYKEKLN